jgi:hypothetical protein
MNCVLLHMNSFIKKGPAKSRKEDYDSDIEIVGDDYDEIFNNMEVVEEHSPRKKKKIKK